jgi:hypothetical protein
VSGDARIEPRHAIAVTALSQNDPAVRLAQGAPANVASDCERTLAAQGLPVGDPSGCAIRYAAAAITPARMTLDVGLPDPTVPPWTPLKWRQRLTGAATASPRQSRPRRRGPRAHYICNAVRLVRAGGAAVA